MLTMYGIYFCELNETIDKSIYLTLLSLVSGEKQQRVHNMRFTIDKKLSLYSEVLVRALACQICGLKNHELSFAKNEYGKPYLTGISQFHFNISHTRNAIAVAVANERIGIDIECIKTTDFNIARRFFTKKERLFIQGEADKENETNKRFYEIWTQKEAYIKFMGKGLSISLGSFDVTKSSINEIVFCVETNGYIISVCSLDVRKKSNKGIVELSEIDLLEMVLAALK